MHLFLQIPVDVAYPWEAEKKNKREREKNDERGFIKQEYIHTG